MNPENETEALKKLVLSASSTEDGLMTAMRRILERTNTLDPAEVTTAAVRAAWRSLHTELHALNPGKYPAAYADCIPFMMRVVDEQMTRLRDSLGLPAGWGTDPATVAS